MDINIADGPVGRVVQQAPYRIAGRQHNRMHTIDNQDICLYADHEAANIVPHQRFGATRRPGMENIACRSRIAVMFRDVAENSSLAYILDEVSELCRFRSPLPPPRRCNDRNFPYLSHSA